MGQCPLCGAQVSDDFGLIECGGCGAQLLVHMDGRVEHSGEDVGSHAPTPVRKSTTTSAIPLDPAVELFAESLEERPPVFDMGTLAEEVPGFPMKAESNFESAQESEFVSASEPEPEPESEPVEDAQPEEAWDPDAAEVPASAAAPAVSMDSSDLSDIAHFGNSGASSSRDGSLRYNLFITGIDTSDVRESFREAITDRKLVWDIDQILRSIKNGEVNIAGVPASKAYIVVSRLRNLPVHVRWEQYAIAQT